MSQVAELFVGVALVGDGSGVAFDGGAGALPGAFEVVLGAFELLLGDVEVVARACGGAGVGRCRVDVARGVMASAGFDGSGFGVVQGVSVGGGGGGDVGAARRRRVAAAAVASARRAACCAVAGFGVVQGALGVGEDGREPVRDLATRRRRRRRRAVGRGVDWARVRRWVVAGMSARSTARIGFEDVAGLGDVVAVGDDAEGVVVAAAGGGDVQAAAGGGR